MQATDPQPTPSLRQYATRKAGEARRSRPVRVAEAIKDWVVHKGLRKGDRLPGEADLIARFAMSKSTIREAMRILEAQGLIETRTGPGGGSFVGEVSAERARALLGNYFYFKDLSIRDIYQIRRALEPELAASLAGTLDAAALADLRGLIDRYPDPAVNVEQEREQHIASLEFHARLADHAKNELLGFLIGFMAQILSDLTVCRQLYNPPNAELFARGRHYQSGLVDALQDGDALRASSIMSAHMEMAQNLMEDQEAQVLKRFIAE